MLLLSACDNLFGCQAMEGRNQKPFSWEAEREKHRERSKEGGQVERSCPGEGFPCFGVRLRRRHEGCRSLVGCQFPTVPTFHGLFLGAATLSELEDTQDWGDACMCASCEDQLDL